ncbi:serine/threonine protein kinase [Microcoleus sp. FACHB-672]|uniref:serine/threonine protein kinase n=1 Tax=Microcoleus sp. FACHB-672 TaxID=2692825 RepID=UPI001687D4EF|nr:serine/threonine-protein kinase [Microcoleus sp. FACHB-672]MBD2042269.1 serine/threonine protein kinase [Microcoleus sp. FACHB-672]
MNLTAGTVLQNGQYVINATLGEGAVGITYRATQTDLNLPVAIKTLNESLRHQANFEQLQKQFQSLARRLQKCQHPNIVRVFDCFKQAGLFYMVMEYIPGQTLAELIQFSQPMPQDQALDYIRQIGSAVGVLHQHGLVHGDIKPQNLIRLEGSNCVVVTDFSIANELSAGQEGTDGGSFATLYGPAEPDFGNLRHTRSTDIYGLATTLYGLLTGQLPVAAQLGEGTVSTNSTNEQPCQSNLSLAVLEAIRCGLETEASRRPQTVDAWLSLLPAGEDMNEIEPAIIEVQGESSGEVEEPASVTSPKTSDRHSSKRFVRLSFILTAVLAGLAGAGFGLSLRFGNAGKVGSGLFNTEQSFPPLKDWPGTETQGLSPYALGKKSFPAYTQEETVDVLPAQEASELEAQPEWAAPPNSVSPSSTSPSEAGAAIPLRQS